jgi:hypothetical protein
MIAEPGRALRTTQFQGVLMRVRHEKLFERNPVN